MPCRAARDLHPPSRRLGGQGSALQGREVVEHYAAALYSEAEHHKWRIASLPGSDFLRLQILRALVAFNGRLLAIEAARRNGIDPDQPPLRGDAASPDPTRPE